MLENYIVIGICIEGRRIVGDEGSHNGHNEEEVYDQWALRVRTTYLDEEDRKSIP